VLLSMPEKALGEVGLLANLSYWPSSPLPPSQYREAPLELQAPPVQQNNWPLRFGQLRSQTTANHVL
jgi:hypothetical protein